MAETVHQRRDELLDLLRDQMAISSRDMADRLGVSQSTLRRDLDALEEEGIVERIHGGARLVRRTGREMDKRELSFYIRLDTAAEEKRAIASAALQFIEPDDVIVLDASSTGFYLSQILRDDLHLTIITHSAYLPVELAGRPNFQVISTGGILHSRSLCYLGLEAENALQSYHAHRAFFGVKGLTLREGCTDASPLEVRLKSVMLKQVSELVILADHSKLGNIALASFAPVSQVHTLVTDEQANREIVEEIRERGVEVVIAPLAPGATPVDEPSTGAP